MIAQVDIRLHCLQITTAYWRFPTEMGAFHANHARLEACFHRVNLCASLDENFSSHKSTKTTTDDYEGH
jgi:hypothetical protein